MLTLDTTPPTVEVTSLQGNDVINANSRVVVAVTGDPSAETAVTYQIDDGEPVAVPFDAGRGAFDRAIDVNRLTEGLHSLTVLATDAAGNSSGEQFEVTFQRTQVGSFRVSDFTPRRGASEVGVTCHVSTTTLFQRLGRC